MGAGTRYGSLKRMLDAGLVKESDKRVDPVMGDERRIYYRATAQIRAIMHSKRSLLG